MAGIKLSKLLKQYNTSYFELVDYLNSFGAGIDEASVGPDYIVSDAYIPYLNRAYAENTPLRQFEGWNDLNEAFIAHRVVKGYVRSRRKGGYTVEVFGINAFCPGSQMDMKRIKDYDAYVDKVFDFLITGLDEDGQNVIVSRRAVLENVDDDFDMNLSAKEMLLGELKDLVEMPFDAKRSFSLFRDIQDRWRQLGPVPQDSFKEINDTYQLYVARFYEMVNASRETRETNFKSNLEAKIALCEQAEALARDVRVDLAYAELQKLHERWKEIGPVSKEYRDSLWERFKAASAMINLHRREVAKDGEKQARVKKKGPSPDDGVNTPKNQPEKADAPTIEINPDDFFSAKALDLMSRKKKS